jgi:autotransporter passenger strand-loop-strand repeat protein
MANNSGTLTAFTAGDLVVSIYGDGDGSGTYTLDQAAPIVLQELTASGSIVGQMVLPETTAVVNGVTENGISGEYGSASEGTLELSADGQSLVIMGYGVNPVAFNTGAAAVYGTTALGQTTSLAGAKYTAVPRIVADIKFNGAVDTSTALYNVFDTNNPRSVATVNGTTFYLSGQGVKGDATQGVFMAHDGADSATAIDTSTDTRSAEIVNGSLYVSRDSTQGIGGEISAYGTTLPTSKTAGTVLPGIAGTITLTAAQENSVNAGAVGTSVDLSPENYFFANPTTLYVADGGVPKNGGIGDGGLQKWVFDGTAWVLEYTLSSGLNQVANTATAGTTGLIGLTGTVIGGTVQFYATNETVGETDQSDLYGIADTLSATTLPTNESFTLLETAAPDTIIRGIAFAPSAQSGNPTITTISAGVSSGGIVVSSGGALNVLSGGTAVAATILSGGTMVVSGGGTDSGTSIAFGASATVLGSASGDFVGGTQLVSAATAVVSDETVLNGGSVDLFLKGAVANSLTVETGGGLFISGNATASNTVINGGVVALESAKAVLSGAITFSGAGSIVVSALTTSAGVGDQAIISGFGTGDIVDIPVIGSGATLVPVVSGANTVATVTSGGISQSFTFAGSVTSNLRLTTDGTGGEEIAYLPPIPTSTTVASGVASSGLQITNGSFVDVLNGGTLVSATIANGGSATIEIGGVDSGATILAGGNELVLGSATLDQVAGTQLVSAATAVVGDETVVNGGMIDLFLKGAIANSVTVNNGGQLNISGNATAFNTLIDSGGLLDLESPKATLSGAVTFAGPGTLEFTGVTSAGFGDLAVISGFTSGDEIDETVIGAGATLSAVTSGGNVVATVTSGAISETFYFAGLATSNLTLTSDGAGGEAIVYTTSGVTSSGTSSGTTITISGGVSSGGVAVTSGTLLDVLSGGTVTNATIFSGGSGRIELGGIDSGSTIASGGVETVLGSATANQVHGSLFDSASVVSATVFAGGTETVAVGGTDTGTTILAAGSQTVLGSANLDQVFGTQLVSAGTAIVSDETVFNGGSIELFLAGVTANSLTASSGGVIAINGHAVANNTVLDGGSELLLESPKATVSGTLTFSGAATLAETAVLSGGFGDLAVISGFAPGDAIDFTAATSVGAAGSAATFSATTSGGETIVTVSGGGNVQTLTFAGTTIGGTLALVGDNAGGEELIACFAAGTRIATDRGQVPVEALEVGDRVATHDGGYERAVWLGRRVVNCAQHPSPETVWPVRVAAGAFGPGLPARDLFLSPDHAVFVSGVLVPVKLLVNGTSIVQTRRPSVTYHHVELPGHAVILAEALPVESYLDTGDRANFHDGAAPIRLFPDFAGRLRPDAALIWEARGAARLVLTGAKLAAAKRVVRRHAQRLAPSRPGTATRGA